MFIGDCRRGTAEVQFCSQTEESLDLLELYHLKRPVFLGISWKKTRFLSTCELVDEISGSLFGWVLGVKLTAVVRIRSTLGGLWEFWVNSLHVSYWYQIFLGGVVTMSPFHELWTNPNMSVVLESIRAAGSTQSCLVFMQQVRLRRKSGLGSSASLQMMWSFCVKCRCCFCFLLDYQMIPVQMDKDLALAVLRLVPYRNFILLKIPLNACLSCILSCSRAGVSKPSPQSG